jgi:hypothetical protein
LCGIGANAVGGGNASSDGRGVGRGSLFKGWFTRIDPRTRVNEKTLARVAICLRIVVFLLLMGHGWLNVIEKKGLLSQYASLGFANPRGAAHAVGFFEIIAAWAVLIRPVGPLLLVLLIWKIASEFFYPHYELFEWIERGGSYGCLLALWFVVRRTPLRNPHMTLAT